MGVDRTDYVIYGVDVGYDNVDYDNFEDEIDGAPDAPFRIIYDGMSGKYAYAGYICAEGDLYEGFGDGVALSPTNDDFMNAMMHVINRFPHVDQKDFKLIAVSHFS